MRLRPGSWFGAGVVVGLAFLAVPKANAVPAQAVSPAFLPEITRTVVFELFAPNQTTGGG